MDFRNTYVGFALRSLINCVRLILIWFTKWTLSGGKVSEVFGILREKHAKTLQLIRVRTPKFQDKRTKVHSPTPRKSKRTLFSTPQKNDLAERHDIISLQKADQMETPCVETLKSAPENQKAMSITIKSFTPSKLKVFWHFIILLLLFSQYQNTI